MEEPYPRAAKVTGDFNAEHYTIKAEEIKIKKRTRYVKIFLYKVLSALLLFNRLDKNKNKGYTIVIKNVK